MRQGEGVSVQRHKGLLVMSVGSQRAGIVEKTIFTQGKRHILLDW
jgi:hypothetical protein